MYTVSSTNFDIVTTVTTKATNWKLCEGGWGGPKDDLLHKPDVKYINFSCIICRYFSTLAKSKIVELYEELTFLDHELFGYIPDKFVAFGHGSKIFWRSISTFMFQLYAYYIKFKEL